MWLLNLLLVFPAVFSRKKKRDEGKDVPVHPTKGCGKVEVYVPSF
jgi:hypothetical protein